MVLENLSSSLKETLKKIARAMFVDEKLIDELNKDIQRALLKADVNVQLVFNLTKSIKDRALKEKPPVGIPQRDYLVKIVYEELVKFLGEKKEEIKIAKKKPFKIMLVGTFGNGKTTIAGKLAKYYSKRGYKIATLGLDMHRPMAPEQLEQISNQVGVKCFIDKKEKNPIKIYKEYEKDFNKFDILIIDTAGRDTLTKDLIKEIKDLNNLIKPHENLLVMGADLGQISKELASKFHETVGVTGIIVTKLDGTAKGGGALTGATATGAKIKFIGVGEKINDLEEFNPKGFVSRLLGMGDLELLLEKTKEAITEEKAEDISKKLMKGEFNLIDLYDQMEAMSKMGPLSKVMDLIPGISGIKDKLPKDMLQVQESKLKKWKFIMQSMTRKELEDPDIITGTNRINRIAKGSGASESDVRELLKQYRQAKKMIKLMKGKDPSKLIKKFKGKIPGF